MAVSESLPDWVPIKLFGVAIQRSAERVRQLSRAEVLPRIQDGKIPFLPALHAWHAYLEKAPGGARSDEEADNVMADQARLLKAQADKAEFEAKRLRGELIPRAAVAASMSMIDGALKDRLMMLPRACVAEVLDAGRENGLPGAADTLARHLNRALSDIASAEAVERIAA